MALRSIRFSISSAKAPSSDLGLGAQLNGPAIATWTNGDVRTLAVTAKFDMSPPRQLPAGEVPATGTIDGTYFQRDGGVDLRTLYVSLPASQVEAHGQLGAYPLTSPSAISVDFHSHDLGEFDRVLRDLGLQRGGKSGTAALPVSLGGQADFHGTWSGSLADPHHRGHFEGHQSGGRRCRTMGNRNAQSPQTVHWDALEATGTYSATRITIAHGQLSKGATSDHRSRIIGVATGPPPKGAGIPSFDSDSLLHMRLNADKVAVDELQPFIGRNLPVTGQINAQIQADGPIHAMEGSGWVELDNGVVYGEPISRIRAQGKIAGQCAATSLDYRERPGRQGVGLGQLRHQVAPLSHRRHRSRH